MANPFISSLTFCFGLIFPGILMVINSLSLNPGLLLTLQIDTLREKTFATFWAFVGAKIAQDFPSDLNSVVAQHCHGHVLDIGPGSGFQLHRFKEVFNAGEIKHIYGVEPGVGMHDQLREKARETFNGTDSKSPVTVPFRLTIVVYTVISAGAQPNHLIPALNKAGLAFEKFDTIVCFRALCGIPQPRETARNLYGLLKPGGCIIVLEHVVAKRPVQGLFQTLYTLLGWHFWTGGCDLRRDTMQTLKDAAGEEGWKEVKVERRYDEKVIPEIYGYLQKR